MYRVQLDASRLIVQCTIPTLAARAIKIHTIAQRARDRGITTAMLRHSPPRAALPETRVTMHVDVARFLVERLQECAAISSHGLGPATRAVAISCGRAVATLNGAIEQAITEATHGTGELYWS